MDLKELHQLISVGETEEVEFKRTTTQRKPAAKTLCGMLNNPKGGTVIFGVTDTGDLKGQEVTSHTLEELTAEFRQISPPVFPKIETIRLRNDLKAILVKISGTQKGIYTYQSRPYIRYGTTTSIMPGEEYSKRLMEHMHTTHRWENAFAPDRVKIDDLDEEEIQITLKNAISLGRMHPPKHSDSFSILKGLGLLKENRLLNAAVALYGKGEKFLPEFPQLSLRIARFRGNDRLSDFADSREYWGHAFNLLRRAETFLLDHMPIAGRVVPGKMIREDYPMYPPRAFREAVANAICHRDYTTPGGAVAIAMYDDQLEIINPGGFHFDLTPEMLALPHESKPWNPLIANAFYLSGVIEKWGTGTLNILDWCQENSNPPPTWTERTNSVLLTFTPSTLAVRPKLGPKLGPKLDLKPLEETVVQLLNKGYPLSSSEIARALKMKTLSGSLKKAIKNLLELEVIEYTIPGKPRSRSQKYILSNEKRY